MDVAEGKPPNPSQKSIRQPRAEPVPLGKQRNGGGQGRKGARQGRWAWQRLVHQWRAWRQRGGGDGVRASSAWPPPPHPATNGAKGHTGTARGHRRSHSDPHGHWGCPRHNPHHGHQPRGRRRHRRPRLHRKRRRRHLQERWQLCSVLGRPPPLLPTSMHPMCLPPMKTRHHGSRSRSSPITKAAAAAAAADGSAAAATAAKEPPRQSIRWTPASQGSPPRRSTASHSSQQVHWPRCNELRRLRAAPTVPSHRRRARSECR